MFRWNTMSPMWEVLWCMPLYCLFPLFLENTPPVLEQAYYFFPPIRGLVVWLGAGHPHDVPYVVALAYTLPMMHQSALGGLMLLAGNAGASRCGRRRCCRCCTCGRRRSSEWRPPLAP